MIYLQVINTEIIAATRTWFEGCIECADESIIEKMNDYEFANGQVVLKWQYPERHIKMSMTFKQAANLAMLMPEFAAMAKQLNIPFVENESGIDYYFEFMLPEHRAVLENLSTITEK